MFLRRSEHSAESEPLACFADNGAHLRAELEWLHQLVRAEIHVSDRYCAGSGLDEFSGLYISREEIDRLLETPAGRAAVAKPDEAVRQLRGRVEDDRRKLDRRVELSIAAGADLRLAQLARAFDLDAVARNAVLCCAGAELDAQISRLFAFMQNDATKRRPSFALLARLLVPEAADPVGVRALFGPACALHAHCLLEPGAAADGLFSLAEARLAPGITDFLIGAERLPAAVAEAAEPVRADAVIDDLAYHCQHRAILEQLLLLRRAEGKLPLSYISGPHGAGARLIAESLAKVIGKRLVVVDAAKVPGAEGRAEDFARTLAREARLRDCVVMIEDAETALRDADRETPRTTPLEIVVDALDGGDVIVSGAIPAAELRHRMRTRAHGFELAYPTVSERIEIWQRRLPSRAAARLLPDIQALAAKFNFTPGQVARTIALAEMVASRDVDGEPCLNGSDLHARCRDEAESGLHQFCQKIIPRYGWDDIVLPADTRQQLQEVCRWVKHRSQVYERWGFGAKLACGKGLAILFSGASGTGKTMSAEVVARDLELDLFRVDLSRIVSKYIGETERNLSRIFSQTSSGNCVLFFDEADALFGKRTEVKDAHDRYANIEINYLLAEMDRYEGIIIIATNMKGNLDQAFIRRFSHVLEYPLPDERLREVIWRKAFPNESPLGSDVDFAFLAQKFNLPGGSIRNIVLSSAFLASEEGQKITMEHVIRATKREHQKIGRVCSKSDFGQYYAMVREAERA